MGRVDRPVRTGSVASGTGDAVMDRSADRALWVIVASATLTVMAGAILGPITNEIRIALEVSPSLAGLIITTHGLFIVLCSPVVGALIDRIGPRIPYIVGLFLYALAGGAGLVVESFVPLLLSRAVLGVGVALIYTSITVLIYGFYADSRKDRVMGLRGSANSVGAAVWPLLGGALGTLAWQLPFGVYLLGIPLGILAALTVPDVQADGGATSGPADERSVLGILRSTPLLVAVYGLMFLTNLLLYANVVYYPPLLEEFGVDTPIVISLYLSVLGLSGGVSAALYDRIRRRFDYRELAGIAFGLWTVAFPLATVASSPAFAVVPMVLYGLGQGLVFPTVLLWVEELVPRSYQGRFSSYVAMAGYVGQFLSPVLFGPVVAAFGVRAVFASAAVVVGSGLLAVLAGGRLTGHGSRPGTR